MTKPVKILIAIAVLLALSYVAMTALKASLAHKAENCDALTAKSELIYDLRAQGLSQEDALHKVFESSFDGSDQTFLQYTTSYIYRVAGQRAGGVVIDKDYILKEVHKSCMERH
ncbi:hypothetical protein [Paraferrimonas haliotis]|uniref:Uncharacterized protein n=1 Tax=Paraferrimonas haliotis TaxID=2013866 RepID=A0AA37TX13_9GAMM|nr:hypothetical protein [Paraferrimonas haliotis]GLS83021.1 hypothetical protein GCM10007894_09980 [Paraferrimonas haliotis]